MKVFDCIKEGHYIANIYDYSEDGGYVDLMYAEDDVQRTFNTVPDAQSELARLVGCEPSEIELQLKENYDVNISSDECDSNENDVEGAVDADNVEKHKKKKTRTSVAAVIRYHKKAYTRIPLDVPKELAQQFKDKCAAEEKSYRAVLIEAIEAFLDKK